MIFCGRSGTGDNLRVIHAMQKYSKKFNNQCKFEVLWKDVHFETLNFQDQMETYQYQFDYLVRLLEDKNFTYEHVLVSDEEYFSYGEFFLHDYAPESNKNGKPINSIYPLGHFLKCKNFHKIQKNKVVVWRDTFLHHEASVSLNGLPKRPLSYDDWQILIKFLQKHYSVIEIEYRTPISEVIYHLSTCDFCIGIEGMWNTLANALRRPQICVFDPTYYPEEWTFWKGGKNVKLLHEHHLGNHNCLVMMNYKIEEITNVDFMKKIYNMASLINDKVCANDIFG